MITYIARRLFIAIATIWAISVVSYAIIQLPPGDFVDSYIARLSSSGSMVSAQEAEAMREQYGLNSPIWVQYGKWISRVVRGDFGVSLEWNRPVTEVIGDRLWLTIVISVAAIILTWGIALPIGIYSAVRQYSIAPWSWGKVWDLTVHLPLPALILALAGTAQLIRIMRANLLDELRRPYVTTARARGLQEWRVIVKYPVRAALNPFASTIGYLLPFVVSGSIVVSLVLSLPTIGPVLLRALVAQDMLLAGAIVLLLGVMTVIGTFFSDLMLMWIDPRIRAGLQ